MRRGKNKLCIIAATEGDIMNTYSTIITLLWLIPVLTLIVVPLLGSLFGTLYRAFDRYRLVQVNGCVVKNNGETAGNGKSESRNRPRIRLGGGKAYIDEENDCCTAEISDISKDGICLKHIPETINVRSNTLRVLFRTREEDYTFTAKPVWKKLTEKGYVFGAEIDRTPSGWENLIKRFNWTCAGQPV